MNSKAILIAAATLLALSAVSCGKDDTESSVSISLSDEVTATKETAAETETATQAETTATETDISETATATTAASETESNTDTTATTSAETTADTTAAETASPAVTQAEETTPPEQPEQQPENDTPTEAPPAETQAPETTQAPEAPEQPQEPEQPEQVQFSMDNLLSDASGIIANLGTPSYSGGGAACLTNGHDDKIYQYDGLEIQCYVDNGTEYIFQIHITGGDYQTDKGIKVGSTRAEVEAAYGAGTESGNMIVYSSGDSEMDIQYNGDTVASIFFYTSV